MSLTCDPFAMHSISLPFFFPVLLPRSFAAITFSFPADAAISLTGDYWSSRVRESLCERNGGKLGRSYFCSPLYVVTQGNRPEDNFDRLLSTELDAVLGSDAPFLSGWSKIRKRMQTKPSKGNTVTVYLMQGPPNTPSYFANLQIEMFLVTPDFVATPLGEEVPLAIDCSLPGWIIRDAVRECGNSRDGRDNVLTVKHGDIWCAWLCVCECSMGTSECNTSV